MVEFEYITAIDILNYSYCPRLIYYIHVLHEPQTITEKEKEGTNKEIAFGKKGKRTKIVKNETWLPKKFNLYLISERLGLKTKLDSIMLNYEKHEAYPIQAKYSYTPRILYLGQKNQLYMEGLLIEDIMKYSVPYGFIKFLKSGELIKVDLSKKEQILNDITEIKSIIEKESFPEPTSSRKKCIDCCYKKRCW